MGSSDPGRTERRPADCWGVVANVVSDRVLRTGAKVWICRADGDGERPEVWGAGKSGRPVLKRTAFKKLTNYRSAWVPPHLRDRVLKSWAEREAADAFARMVSPPAPADTADAELLRLYANENEGEPLPVWLEARRLARRAAAALLDPTDVEVQGADRELAGTLHDAVLRETGDPDRALDEAADAARALRERWEEAKREDDRTEGEC